MLGELGGREVRILEKSAITTMAREGWHWSGSVPTKFQPVRSVVDKPYAVEVLGLVAGGAVELRGREVRVGKVGRNHDAPVKSAFVSVAELKEALVSVAELKEALVSVAELKEALVRFCPAKFQPVRSLDSSPMPWRSLAW